ncbi:hypothetical protein CRH09_39690 (plasmid) [Nocardia terpenica]|uniref:Uncharacterized protein n=2 Tax=Nocardia terpenica TaxID=455432 RepID=A0A291RYZ3_9NOCA|nr:hypothetical protein CRH09_39690 [Nocardia terpenica]
MAPQHYGSAGKAAMPGARKGSSGEAAKNTKSATMNKGRIGAYFDPDEADRVRAAYQFGWLQDHTGSFSDYLKSIILADVENLEREKNGGQPWQPVKAGAVRVVTHQQIADKKRAAAED